MGRHIFEIRGRDAGTSVGQGGQKKSLGQYKLMKNKKIVTNYQVRRLTRRGAGGLVSPEKNFAPPRKNVLDIVQKMAPLSKLLASPGVPIWLGPVNYASYSSTIMLTSKITKQTIDNLFQFDLDIS